MKVLDFIGGKEGVDKAYALAPEVVAELSSYVEIVVEKSRLRQAINVGRHIVEAAAKPDADAQTVTELAESTIFELGGQKTNASSMTPMAKAVPEILAQISAGRDSLLAGHTTGLEDLDKMTGGLQPGQLWIVAARPGVGKSALACCRWPAQWRSPLARLSVPVIRNVGFRTRYPHAGVFAVMFSDIAS